MTTLLMIFAVLWLISAVVAYAALVAASRADDALGYGDQDCVPSRPQPVPVVVVAGEPHLARCSVFSQ